MIGARVLYTGPPYLRSAARFHTDSMGVVGRDKHIHRYCDRVDRTVSGLRAQLGLVTLEFYRWAILAVLDVSSSLKSTKDRSNYNYFIVWLLLGQSYLSRAKARGSRERSVCVVWWKLSSHT
jgi:hypothetical protein